MIKFRRAAGSLRIYPRRGACLSTNKIYFGIIPSWTGKRCSLYEYLNK